MKPLCIAHRGRHKEYFENTVGAFKEAANGFYYGIETDIHLSKDKKWVIHHDEDFLSDGKKYIIKDETAEKLFSLPLDNEFGIKDAYIPSLEQYLDIVKGSGKRPIIEIKPKNPSFRQLRKMKRIVKSRFDLDDVTFIAFYPWPLMKLKLFHKRRIHVQQLVGDQSTEAVLKIARLWKFDIDMDENVLTKELVEEWHKKGRKVNIWTVDKKENLEHALDLNVDFITTNEFNQNS